VKDADPAITADLKDRGALIHKGQITHEYPECWRCDTPLLQVATPQWFFGATQFRDTLLDFNESIQWMPDWAGEKFDDWLQQLGDWPVSRQRYWGIPLPIWECTVCDNTRVIGSTDELPRVPDDLHRPYVDEVTLPCSECSGEMERIPDVLDVWFDSGVAPWASLQHPETDFSFEEDGPVDLEIEGFDQFRGWWNSQFITSAMTWGEKPFENVVYHGMVMLEGKEMSKSRGIVVYPDEAIEKYGRDILRFYILSKDPSENWSFRWKGMNTVQDMLNTLYNVYTYAETYIEDQDVSEPDQLNEEDEWLLSRLHSLTDNMRTAATGLEAYDAAHALSSFIVDDLSKTYVKLIRDRLRPGHTGDDRAAAWTLRTALQHVSRLLAPFTPYIAEYVFDGDQSVHLTGYPEPDTDRRSQGLEAGMNLFRDISQAAGRLRQQHGIKLRHPVKKITVAGNADVEQAVEHLRPLLRKQLNAKTVAYTELSLSREVKLDYEAAGPELGAQVKDVEDALAEADHEQRAQQIEAGEPVELAGIELEPDMFDIRTHLPGDVEGAEFSQGVVMIDTERTPELEEEAFIAELVRTIQHARKDAGLDVDQEIALTIGGDTGVVEKHRDTVEERLVLSSLSTGDTTGDHTGDASYKDYAAHFTFTPA
jgi:isoleucyl-tRNA synthetase